ncbi:MAG: histidine kinase [Undibacterium sp.]|nr:histidine kinase [Undibacterium sp.]
MNQRIASSASSDQQIPAKLIGQFGDWNSKAKLYPIFSETWFRLKMRSYRLIMVFIAILTLATLIILPPDKSARYYLGFFLLGFSFILAIFAGRFLAVVVCKRRWSSKKEGWGVCSAIVIGWLLALLVLIIGNEVLRPIREQLYASASSESTSAAKAPYTSPKSNTQHTGLSPASLSSTSDKSKNENEDEAELAVRSNAGIVNFAIYIIVILTLGGVFDLLPYFRQRMVIKEAQAQEELERYKFERNQAEMRLSILASQVEPHFLFNTLSGVRSAMLSDPACGVKMIDHLVAYFRATIPQMRDDGRAKLSDLATQLTAIRAYLGLIQIRFPRLEVEIDNTDDLLDCIVPPLMLISLVENAVKHGIEPKKGAVKISVVSKQVMIDNAQKLQINVIDNGVGFGGATSGTGIGLSNIQERLKQLYGDQAALTLSSRDEGGIEASLILPFTKRHQH